MDLLYILVPVFVCVCVCVCVTMQMVRLYRDPDGTTVFTAHENAMRITTSTAAVLDTYHNTMFDGEINGLRKRVKELENVIVAYKVTILFILELLLW